MGSTSRLIGGRRWIAAALLSLMVARPASAGPLRVVSLSPHLTQVVVALGGERELAGITDRCPAVTGAVRVGPPLSPSAEGIATLRPGLILGLPLHEGVAAPLRDRGVTTALMPQPETLSAIGELFVTVGRLIGREAEGIGLRASWKRRIDGLRQSVPSHRSRLLVAVDRHVADGRVAAAYGACGESFLDEAVTLAGGINVCGGMPVPYPKFEGEGLRLLAPEVVVEVTGNGEAARTDQGAWAATYPDTPPRVLTFAVADAAVPGPGLLDFVERLREELR